MSDELKQPDDQPGKKEEQARHSEGASKPELSAPFGNQPGTTGEGDATTVPQNQGQEAGPYAESVEARKQDSREDSAASAGDPHHDSSDPFSPDYTSPAEKLLDLLALEGHEAHLAAGFPRADGQDAPTMIDLIRSTHTKEINVCLFQSSDPNYELSFDKEIRSGEGTYSVPNLSPTIERSLLLPTWMVNYGSTRELFSSIQALLKEHLGLGDQQCKLLTYWAIATWFPDFLDFVPRLVVTGPTFAADHLFRVLRCVCRRPLLLAGINSATLRAVLVGELMPTLFIRRPRLGRSTEFLDAPDQQGYLIVHGKDVYDFHGAKCIYVGECRNHVSGSAGIHIHVATRELMSDLDIPSEAEADLLQCQLFRYRAFNRELVGQSEFKPGGLSPELRVVARQLGAVIVESAELQAQVVDLLREQNEQARVDRGTALNAMVLRAVLVHCHDGDQSEVFVRDIAATVNNIYREEGESIKVSNERVGHVLKSLGLYTRRLSNAGRGLMLDQATRFQVHELSYLNDALRASNTPACGYCHELQVKENEGLV
jgi:hypothetical protein